MLLGGDSARDYTRDGCEDRETFIAVGCQTGKVLVYNVLGLLVYEVSMDGLVVSLEWIGDMTGPSTLPTRKSSLPTRIEEENKPILKSILDHEELTSSDDSEADHGTVKRKPLPDPFVLRSPLRFDGGRDLFSTDPPASFLRRTRSGIPRPSFSSPDSNPAPARRKSFLRPRIVTETFKNHSTTPVPPRSLPLPPLSPTTTSVQEVLKKTDSRQVFDVFFADALRARRSRSPSATSQYSRSSGSSDIWSAPPVTKKESGRSNPVGHKYASGAERHLQPFEIMNEGRGSPPSPNFSRPLRKVREDGEEGILDEKVSLPKTNFVQSDSADRELAVSEGAVTSIPQVKRSFSFESGVYPLEKKCEESFCKQERRRGDNDSETEREEPDDQRGHGMTVRSASGSEARELIREHRKLRREMALLREEFRAFREGFEKEKMR